VRHVCSASNAAGASSRLPSSSSSSSR
jgi:hypothetical protein